MDDRPVNISDRESRSSERWAFGAVCGGDVSELYRVLSGRVEQIVRLDVSAPDPVIEDACQFAWTRLVHHRHRVRRDSALPWLVKTAVHEAFKLIRRESRELSLDAVLDQCEPGLDEPAALSVRAPAPEDLIEQRERLAVIRRLPERQQRLLWLQAAGLSYAEMAAHEGSTLRTVERQLLRAKRGLRDGVD
jgi:RNA polymerase sigma factor (sigma-70 family)